MQTTLNEIRTIDLHINGAMVVRTLRSTPVVMRDGVLMTPADYEDVRAFYADRQEMLTDLAAAEKRALDAAGEEATAVLGDTEDDTLDYRTLAPCGLALARILAKYECYNEGCNWTLGIGKMLTVLDRVVHRAAASLHPVEASLSAAIEEVNSRSPRNRELCVLSLQRAVHQAADAFTASELSRVQIAIDRAVYAMMRETARVIGIDADEEWISKMEAKL